MTALKDIERLESHGLWRPAPDAQRREVAVFFREATLVLVDKADRPLSHWSLPAIERLNPGSNPAIYSPDPDGLETLEIDDSTLIDALETVRRSISHPRPGRLRMWFGAGALALLLLGAIIWLPGALREQVVRTLPQSARAALDARLVDAVTALTGPTCNGHRGQQALSRLHKRVNPAPPAPVLVVPANLPGPQALPGGTILLGRTMVETPQDPAATAGYIIEARTRARHSDPLRALLTHGGVLAALEMLTTGTVNDSTIAREAELLISTPPKPAPQTLITEAFDGAALPMGPWRAHAGLAQADPQTAASASLLTDEDWLSLQAICES